MIISSGWCKGMKVAVANGLNTRPTSAKVRSAVMNILQGELEGAVFLDLFAGFGAVGIEALSRGARGAVFVEQARVALEPLRTNLTEMRRRAANAGLDPRPLEVLATDVDRCWDRLGQVPAFDIVWADPPYREAPRWAARILDKSRAIIRPEGVVVIESGDPLTIAPPEGWEPLKPRHYGETHVTLWRRLPNDSPQTTEGHSP